MEPCGGFPGRRHRGKGKEQRVPVLALPSLPTSSMPTELSQPAGNGAGFMQGMLSCVPCSGDGVSRGAVLLATPRAVLTAGDVPVGGGEAVRGGQGAAAALPQPPVAAVVGLAAPAGTPRQTAAPKPSLATPGGQSLKFKAIRRRRRRRWQGSSGAWLGNDADPTQGWEAAGEGLLGPPGWELTLFWVLTGQWDPRGCRCPRCRRNSRTSCRTAGRSSPWPP